MFEKIFLVEIGIEELLLKVLRSLVEFFVANFIAELDNVGFVYGIV